MSVHQSNPNALADGQFVPGEIRFLVPGNFCRLRDQRRTPGRIEAYHPERASFVWAILDFEDKGKCWVLPVEEISRFQFSPDAFALSEDDVRGVREASLPFQRILEIPVVEAKRHQTEAVLLEMEREASAWLEARSRFLASGATVDWGSRDGDPKLADDLMSYLAVHNLEPWEERTAEGLVLNPGSGDWVRGMRIVLAEMGLVAYSDRIPRDPEVFDGDGERSKRERYLRHRLAFLRALFRHLGRDSVVLYRGMAVQGAWEARRPSSFSSWTFSREVAEAFADFGNASRHAALWKRTVPIEALFMTYLETPAMNRQYREAEALVLAASPFLSP